MVALFPSQPVQVVVDGRPLLAYRAAHLVGGRVLVPLDPYLIRFARVVAITPAWVVMQRAGVQVRLRPTLAAEAGVPSFAMGPALREFGFRVRFDNERHTLYVTSPTQAPIMRPTPFNATLPEVPPRVVFPSVPAATPRPVVTGTPRPRRTPIPLSFWRATPSPKRN